MFAIRNRLYRYMYCHPSEIQWKSHFFVFTSNAHLKMSSLIAEFYTFWIMHDCWLSVYHLCLPFAYRNIIHTLQYLLTNNTIEYRNKISVMSMIWWYYLCISLICASFALTTTICVEQQNKHCSIFITSEVYKRAPIFTINHQLNNAFSTDSSLRTHCCCCC